MSKLILISGAMRSGKNQFATYLKEELIKLNKTVEEDLFAQTLKDWCREDFSYLSQVINEKLSLIQSYDWSNGKISEICEDLKVSDEKWYEEKNDITRAILQIYGTDVFRDRVDDQWWIKKLAERVHANKAEYTIVTDARFDNEVSFFTEDPAFDTTTMNVFRKSTDTSLKTKHSSEAGISNHLIEFQIDNNDSLEELRKYAVDIAAEL